MFTEEMMKTPTFLTLTHYKTLLIVQGCVISRWRLVFFSRMTQPYTIIDHKWQWPSVSTTTYIVIYGLNKLGDPLNRSHLVLNACTFTFLVIKDIINLSKMWIFRLIGSMRQMGANQNWYSICWCIESRIGHFKPWVYQTFLTTTSAQRSWKKLCCWSVDLLLLLLGVKSWTKNVPNRTKKFLEQSLFQNEQNS